MTTTKFGGTGHVLRRWLAVGATLVLAVPLVGCGGSEPKADKRVTEQPSTSKGTAPGPQPGSWVPEFVAAMRLEEKVGQLFVPAFGSLAGAKEMIRSQHVGGFIYFPDNTRDPAQTARLSNDLQAASKVPLLIGVDEEQGIVTRLPYITSFPGNMALGATRSPADARDAARVTGAELRAVGINQNYAPVADVNVNPANPVIGLRSFGADPALVSQLVSAAIEGYQAAGVAATAKHFPGHGDTATDSHTGLPVIRHSRKDWERIDAPPFRAAIEKRVDAIMTAHIVVPGLDDSGDPATMSRAVLTDLLRGKLGYGGVVVTDSLRMAGATKKYKAADAAVRAVRAGADQLLMPPDLPDAYAAVLRAARAGTIPRGRIDEAVTRILRLKEQRGIFGKIRADPDKAERVVGAAAHRAVVRRVADHSITLVRNTGGLLPLRDRRVYVTGPRSAELSTALRRAGGKVAQSAGAADVTVLTTLNSGTSSVAAQVRALDRRPVVLAVLGRPYDLAGAASAKAALATYSTGNASVHALARTLTGTNKPTGKLPVTAGPFRIGTGLGY